MGDSSKMFTGRHAACRMGYLHFAGRAQYVTSPPYQLLDRNQYPGDPRGIVYVRCKVYPPRAPWLAHAASYGCGVLLLISCPSSSSCLLLPRQALGRRPSSRLRSHRPVVWMCPRRQPACSDPQSFPVALPCAVRAFPGFRSISRPLRPCLSHIVSMSLTPDRMSSG
jgi:hypothetical protein